MLSVSTDCVTIIVLYIFICPHIPVRLCHCHCFIHNYIYVHTFRQFPLIVSLSLAPTLNVTTRKTPETVRVLRAALDADDNQ